LDGGETKGEVMGSRGRGRVLVVAAVVTALGALGAGSAAADAGRLHRLPPAVRVSAMTAGPEGKLWFAGYRGVAQPPAPPSGGLLGSISPQGKVSGYPTGEAALAGIAVGADGALWSTEPASARIVRVSTTGAVSTFAVPGAGAELSSIAAGPDGALWFTEGRRDEVGRITTAGAVSEFPLPAGSDAGYIVAGGDGALWLAAAGTDSIDRVGTDGSVTSFPIGGGPANAPRSLALGPDGNIFFTQRSPRIGRISPGGQIVEFGRPRPAGLIAAAGEDLWFTTRTRPYKDSFGPNGGIASMTTDGQATGAPCLPLRNGECSAPASALAAGPEGALWFAEGTRSVVGGGASYELALEEPVVVGPFTPPPLRLSVLGPAMLRGGKARLDLLCGGGSAGDGCRGRLILSAEGAGGTRLGSVRFDLRSGEAGFTEVKLSPKARKLIAVGAVSRLRVSSGFPLAGKRSLRLERAG
jgi:virginiamycin B lyase